MELTREKACVCALNRIFGFEPKIGLALLAHLGKAEDVFSLKDKDLDYILGPFSKFRNRIDSRHVDLAAEELLELEKKGIRFTGWNEEHYPALLKECEDAPIGLYIKSSTPDHLLWNRKRVISVVGTRDISPYGKEWCGRIVRRLGESPEKPVIVSGLAIGTDICAHKTAVDVGLPTVAVMATGADSIYPLRHSSFAERLSNTAGCALVTDYPPGTQPLAIHFLRRNRIIAGLSEATLLVESKIKGGGMMTANLAFSYGRGVYAVPGRIDDLHSQGCNRLISSKIAEAVTGEDEFLKSLGMKTGPKGRTVSDKERIMSLYSSSMAGDRIEMLAAALIAIRSRRGITIEELSENLGISYSQTSQLIGILESDGLIRTDLLQRCCINIDK